MYIDVMRFANFRYTLFIVLYPIGVSVSHKCCRANHFATGLQNWHPLPRGLDPDEAYLPARVKHKIDTGSLKCVVTNGKRSHANSLAGRTTHNLRVVANCCTERLSGVSAAEQTEHLLQLLLLPHRCDA